MKTKLKIKDSDNNTVTWESLRDLIQECYSDENVDSWSESRKLEAMKEWVTDAPP